MPGRTFVVEDFATRAISHVGKTALINPYPAHKGPAFRSSLNGMMKYALVVAQWVGLFPVAGVRRDDPAAMVFKWVSWRTLYTLFVISGNVTMATFFFYWISMRGLKLENMGSLAFYSTSLCCTVLFLRLAQHWPKLAREWHAIEIKLSSVSDATDIYKKYNVLLALVLALAIIEHVLAVAISFGWISKCTHENLAITHIKADFPQAFCYIEYNHLKAFLIEYFNWVSTFNWNFNDVFIVLVSEIMTEKFRHVNNQMRNFVPNKINDHNFYRTMREDYCHLTNLCSSLNDALCHLVSLSFLSNVLQICIQLYNILRVRETLVEYFYFYFSLGFIVARAMCVSFYASAINDESKVPLALLNSVPSNYYNTEVSRFIQQIHTVTVALTGSHFFPITRNLLISVSSTIIAYELVLIQLPRPLTKVDLFFKNATDDQKLKFICNVTRLCDS